MARCRRTGLHVVALVACGLGSSASLSAQAPSYQPPGQPTIVRDYVIGPHDVLAITSPGDPTLTGRFTVDADLTLTYPLIGRVRAGGLTLREVDAELQRQLVERGFYKDPQILVTIEQSKSRHVSVVGDVRRPGTYAMTGDMRLVEALTLAGAKLPTAAGEAVIVPAGAKSMVVASTRASASGLLDPEDSSTTAVTRVNLHDLEHGAFAQNIALKDGDTVFVLRADTFYVFGLVKNPGAHPLNRDVTTVLQALAIAGGGTYGGSRARIEIMRFVNAKQIRMNVTLHDVLRPEDTILVAERLF